MRVASFETGLFLEVRQSCQPMANATPSQAEDMGLLTDTARSACQVVGSVVFLAAIVVGNWLLEPLSVTPANPIQADEVTMVSAAGKVPWTALFACFLLIFGGNEALRPSRGFGMQHRVVSRTESQGSSCSGSEFFDETQAMPSCNAGVAGAWSRYSGSNLLWRWLNAAGNLCWAKGRSNTQGLSSPHHPRDRYAF